MKQRSYFQLNASESVVGSSDVSSVVFDHGGFILTNQRVINVVRSRFGGESAVHTIALENLDSVQITARKFLIFLVLGALLVAIGGSQKQGEGNARYVLFAAAAVSVLLYFLTRRKVIRLASGNSEMLLNVQPMAHEQIQALAFEVEQATQRRLEGLQRRQDSSKEKADASDVRSRLEVLSDLHERGILTDTEYQEKRAKILDDL